MSLGIPDTPVNRHQAEAKASDIQADICNGRFDQTLERYLNPPDQSPPAGTLATTGELFDQFIEHKRRVGVSGQSIAARYKPLRANIERLGRNIRSGLKTG